jgi:hypothetical protein
MPILGHHLATQSQHQATIRATLGQRQINTISGLFVGQYHISTRPTPGQHQANTRPTPVQGKAKKQEKRGPLQVHPFCMLSNAQKPRMCPRSPIKTNKKRKTKEREREIYGCLATSRKCGMTLLPVGLPDPGKRQVNVRWR